MRLIIALTLLLAAVSFAQEASTPISKLRQQSRDLFEVVYRRPEVAAFCDKNPEGSITVKMNGGEYDFAVDCIARKAYLALAEAGVR